MPFGEQLGSLTVHQSHAKTIAHHGSPNEQVETLGERARGFRPGGVAAEGPGTRRGDIPPALPCVWKVGQVADRAVDPRKLGPR
jgi:hypothetical protein